MGDIRNPRLGLSRSASAKGYDLDRFKKAQRMEDGGQATALGELRSGGKRSHWIWYILPQLSALGKSDRSHFYGISCLDEAILYLRDDELQTNLYEVCDAILDCRTDDPVSIMGSEVDAMKLRSSMTLFELASGRDDLVLSKIIDRMFGGVRDPETLSLVGQEVIEFA